MAKDRNCPNCGAPYDPLEPKCPYCGTIYYDMSAIDFDSKEPLYLQIRVNNMLITQKVIPEIGNIEMSSNAVSFGSTQFVTDHTVTTNVSFIGVAGDDGAIMQVKYCEETKEN